MLIITAVNRSNLAAVSDYDVDVFINHNRIWSGSVNGHERAKGFPDLLRMIADAAEKKETP